MEILDPDLWNDDGTPKRPTPSYLESLAAAQSAEALQEGLKEARDAELAEAMRQFKKDTPPSVGDMVHFWGNDEGKCFAAIVMETVPGTHEVELRVHIPHKPFEDWFCTHDEGRGEANGWHWPESS